MNQDQVAQTILDQLGGNTFCTMVGVKHAFVMPTSLAVTIPTSTTKNKANRMKVTLTPADEYDVLFYRMFGKKMTPISTHNGVHACELRGLFEIETGLRTSLTTIYGK